MEKNDLIIERGFSELHLLADLKILLSGYYAADVRIDVNKVVVKFDVGKTFVISVEEKK